MAIITKGAFLLLTMMITCIISISLSSSSKGFASLPLNPGFSYISPHVEEGQQLGLARGGATIVLTKLFPCLHDVTSHPKNIPSHCCQLLIELPTCVLPKFVSRVAEKILKGIKGVCKVAGSKAAFLGPVPSALGLPPAVNLVENMDIYG